MRVILKRLTRKYPFAIRTRTGSEEICSLSLLENRDTILNQRALRSLFIVLGFKRDHDD